MRVAIAGRTERPGVLADAERLVTQAHAEAVEDFLKAHHIAREDVDVIGFHGQTVLHRPEQRLTVQIGDGASLAKATRIPVVYDLRAADVATGGQGAPLVPVYHSALVRSLDLDGPVCVVNIGGVSNISYVDGDVLIACDTGPGNALLDDFMLKATGEAVDRDGALAARGRADEAWIAASLQLPFFALPPPKSLDRNAFASLTLPDLAAADGAATLTAFTAAAIADIVPQSAQGSEDLDRRRRRREQPDLDADAGRSACAGARRDARPRIGWQGDAIEAQAFAFLGVRSLKGLPLTFPQTTGVPAPLTGGVLAKP